MQHFFPTTLEAQLERSVHCLSLSNVFGH